MGARQRRQRIAELLEQVEQWEQSGLDIFAALVDITEPDDALGLEVRRVLDLLAS